jgi:hypothetical protein
MLSTNVMLVRLSWEAIRTKVSGISLTPHAESAVTVAPYRDIPFSSPFIAKFTSEVVGLKLTLTTSQIL